MKLLKVMFQKPERNIAQVIYVIFQKYVHKNSLKEQYWKS